MGQGRIWKCSAGIRFPLAVLLVLTAPGGVLPWPRFNCVAGAFVNAFRATPFIVLPVALIPLTQLITGAAAAHTLKRDAAPSPRGAYARSESVVAARGSAS